MPAGDVNGTLVNQYGPYPTTGIGTGAAVTIPSTLLLTNYYVTGNGGSESNSGVNFLGQLLGDTP